MASSFAKVFEQVGQLHKTDDDLTDRLNHRYTVVLLVIFITFISAKQFVGNPISCWTPAHYSGPQISYTNSICWLKGTYYLEADRPIIPQHTLNPEFRVAYYQFIPYILIVLAALFYAPHMLWRSVGRSIGFDLRLLIQISKRNSEADIKKAASQIHTSLKYNCSKHTFRQHRLNPRLENLVQYSFLRQNSLCTLYLFVKLLYMLNCIYQFSLLTQFLQFSFLNFGYEWLVKIATIIHRKANIEPNDSKWFPRVVMCDFMIRQLGSNQHRMVVQCNLPINLFNELIFMILWAWLIFLTGLTCLSFILSSMTVYSRFGSQFLHKYLNKDGLKVEKHQRNKFINEYLGLDGALVLRIIAQNTSDVLMNTLVSTLFKIYSKSCEQNDNDDDDRELISKNGLYSTVDN
ncbi:unnamed protein product [Adineta ricciae]|uniref:Innexin n=1 Tax=Adineta ricciae TaxID=249248 RepID=A0A816FK29_ADIRI|nr:unnamed protein product [Adineta ricciae]